MNIVSVLLIVISVGALAAATLFFREKASCQDSLNSINTAYDSKMIQLNQVTSNLEEKQAALEQIKSELTQANIGLENVQVNASTSLQTTKTQLEALKGEYEMVKTELDKSKQSISSLNKNITVLSKNITVLNNQLVNCITGKTVLNKKIDDYKDSIDALQSKISCLQTQLAKPDAEEGSC